MSNFKALCYFFIAIFALNFVNSLLINDSDGNIITLNEELGYEKAFTANCDVHAINKTFVPIPLFLGSMLKIGGNIKYIVNFQLQPDDQVLIKFTTDPFGPAFGYIFTVYNAANKQGYGSQSDPKNGTSIATSRQLTFEVLNECQSNCNYQIYSSNARKWRGSQTSILVFINGNFQKEFDGNDIIYLVHTGDVITYVVTSTASDIPNGLTAATRDLADFSIPIFEWFSNSYYTPMIVPNECTRNLPASPFGGILSPVTPQDISRFLSENSAPLSAVWVQLTENFDM